MNALIWSYITANIGSWARIALGAAATWVVSKGLLDTATANAVTGALLVIGAAIWAGVKNWRDQQGKVVAMNAGIAVADATAGKTMPVSSASEAAVLVAATASGYAPARPAEPPAEPKPTQPAKPKRKHVKKAR